MQTKQTKTAKQQRIIESLSNDKNFVKSLSKANYYNVDEFVKDAQTYINAIKDRRMLCIIRSVSRSGMSRNIKFFSSEKSKYKESKSFYTRNYFAIFKVLGYRPADSHSHDFRIGGCGMDMIFHTNYTIIHKLHRMGFINKIECEKLAQETPQVI